MKKVMHVALLLLLAGNSCFALEATFSKEHACIPAGENISSCEVHWGDTLSKDAIAVYGDWHPHSRSLIKDANPQITDENKIYMGTRINIPDSPAETAKATSLIEEVISPEVFGTIAMVEMADMPLPTVTLTQMSVQTGPTAPAPAPISEKAMQSMKIAKVTAYQFMAGNPDLQGSLQTQLVLFNSEEEKSLGLPCGNCRIDLKPSLAIPAKDGDTVVLVRLKALPAQPFKLLVGGIKDPVDSTQILPYTGKIPGRHPLLSLLKNVARIGTPAGISFLAGGPVGLGIAVGIPQLIHLGIALHEKAHEHKMAAAQAVVDRSKLAFYKASTESNTLSKKEIPQ